MDKQRAIAKAVTCLDSRFVEEAAQSEEHKRISWKPLLSAAACLLLVAGLWLFRPTPLKVTVNGENVLNRTVSWSQDGDAQVMRLSLETEIPLTLEPGSKASLTLTADENSALALDGGAEKTLTLTKKTGCTWILIPRSGRVLFAAVPGRGELVPPGGPAGRRFCHHLPGAIMHRKGNTL